MGDGVPGGYGRLLDHCLKCIGDPLGNVHRMLETFPAKLKE